MFKCCIVLFFITFQYINVYSQNNFYSCFSASSQKYVEGKFEEALKINLKALETAEKIGNPSYIAYSDLQVGNMHYFLHDKKSAIKWYMAAMTVIEQDDIDSMKSEIYHNTSVMYNEMNELDSTFKYSKKAIDLLKVNKNYTELSRALSTLADLYIHRICNFTEAQKLVSDAEKYAHLSKDDRVLAFALTKRAQLFAKQNKYKEAIEQLKIPEKIYLKDHVVDELLYLYRMKTYYYIKTGNLQGLDYLDLYLNIKDSVFKNETAKKSAEYEVLYQTEKKERENQLLFQANGLKETKIVARNYAIMGMAIVIILIIVLVAWRISILNLKKKEQTLVEAQKLQKEKERISRDLHDNVGGQLSYVLYSLDGITDVNREKRDELISEINDSVRSVISNLRETIWAINDESISINDFSDKFKVYTRAMFKNTDAKVIFNEQINDNIKLNSLVGLNLFRSCQEIINNAFKYSKANTIEITITAKDKITIIVADNGIGFDLEKINKDGFGISNIKSRADEFGISLNLKTELNKGSIYTLIV